MGINTLSKPERLNSKIAIEKLFSGGAKSFSSYPLRVVFMEMNKGEQEAPPCLSLLISVPKKRFKRAVDRNRVKRQIREAFRKNKHTLLKLLEEKKLNLSIAVIYLSDDLLSSTEIENKLKLLLVRINDKTV
ncbi:ribonuclease P protein component [uncultured Bacteroides sp.]|uniref:ribonuclease P protein component n=1 Tax=uncultured Bacteroides sp. TaxID=162156 RepID=UPI002AAAC9F6|nr:ribonuclease P protein component [uncultured Bacteroides sp.]